MAKYKILVLFTFSLLGSLSCNSAKTAVPAAATETRPYVKNSLIIYYDKQIGKEELLRKIKEYGAEPTYQYSIINAVAITLPKNKVIQDAEAYFKKVRGVLQVEKDYIQSTN